MSIKRTTIFPEETIDAYTVPDYIASSINNMQLSTTGTITVEEQYVSRPDLIAYVATGEARLWWLIMYHNDIIDPFTEIQVGTELKIPDISEFYRFVNENGIRA